MSLRVNLDASIQRRRTDLVNTSNRFFPVVRDRDFLGFFSIFASPHASNFDRRQTFRLTSTILIPQITRSRWNLDWFLGLARSGNSHHKWPPLLPRLIPGKLFVATAVCWFIFAPPITCVGAAISPWTR